MILFLGFCAYVFIGVILFFMCGVYGWFREVDKFFYCCGAVGLTWKIVSYAFICFFWSSIFHTLWIVFFSARTEDWVSTLRFSNLIYLFMRALTFFCFSILILGLVVAGVAKKPFSDFHQYFSILIPCLLLGGWVWSVRDFFIAIFNYARRDVV